MTRIFSRLLPLLLLSCFLPGCNDAPKSGLATIDMQLGSKKFTLEIVAKNEERNKGLMYRDSMADNHGMIFIFQKDQQLSFFMKNTRIPLDIIYVNSTGKVVSVKQMQPYVLDSVPSDFPAEYAIELNVNAAGQAGVKTGDTLNIPDAIRKTQADPSPQY